MILDNDPGSYDVIDSTVTAGLARKTGIRLSHPALGHEAPFGVAPKQAIIWGDKSKEPSLARLFPGN
jgi:hypothetical protein